MAVQDSGVEEDIDVIKLLNEAHWPAAAAADDAQIIDSMGHDDDDDAVTQFHDRLLIEA